MKKLFFIITLLFLINVNGLYAQDEVQLEGGSIFGNQESPKALFIVPWRPLASADMTGVELETLLGEELEMIDRDAFKRQVELYQITHK